MLKRFLLVALLIGAATAANAQILVGGDGTGGGAGCSLANPTATIGASAVNGVAITCMRSDASPPLPSTLPALSGINLTALNASNLGSGTVATARGGFGTDVSAVTGIALWATGTPTFTATTGSGNVVRATSPTLVTPNLGTPTAITLTSGTGLPISTGVSGLGTGVAAALAIAKDTSGGVCTVGGGGCAGGGVSVTAGTPNVVINPTPGTGTFTVSLTNALRANTTTSDTIVSGDAGKTYTTSNASAQAITLPTVGTSGFGSGFAFNFSVIGAGTGTITSASNIDGLGNIPATTGQGGSIYSDGTTFHAIMGMPQLAADAVLMNASAATRYPFAAAVNNCSTALTYSTSTHSFGCSGGGSGTVTTLTAGTNITFSSGATCTTTCTINASGSLTAAYTLTASGNVSGTPSTAGLGLVLSTATFTDNNTAGSGTAAFFPVHTIAIPTIAATNTSVTTTYTPTLTIDGAPTCGTNETCTAKGALYLKAGNLDFGTAGQKLQMFNLGTPGATNREVASIGYISNVFTIRADKNGTGANDDISIISPNNMLIDGGTGINFAYGGTNKVTLGSSYFAQSSFSAWLLQNNCTTTNATPCIIPNSNGGGITNSGLGGGTDGSVSLDVLGVEVLRAGVNKKLQFTGSTATAASNSVAATCTDHCNDIAGRFTVGATPNASLVVTFGGGSWSTAPVCTAQDETASASMPVGTVSTTAVTFTKASTLTASDKVSYLCVGTL
jgi:hypothetical protein